MGALPDPVPIRLVCGQEVIRVPQGAAFSSRGMVWRAPRERTISSSRLVRLEIGTRLKDTCLSRD